MRTRSASVGSPVDALHVGERTRAAGFGAVRETADQGWSPHVKGSESGKGERTGEATGLR